jgi:hypothetical protein
MLFFGGEVMRREVMPKLTMLLLLITCTLLAQPKPPKVSLDVRDATIQEVASMLSKQANVKIKVAQNVTGKVTIAVKDIYLDDLLDIILPPLKLKWRMEKDAYIIEPASEPVSGLERPPTIQPPVEPIERPKKAPGLPTPSQPKVELADRGLYPGGIVGFYYDDPDHAEYEVGAPPKGPFFTRFVMKRLDPQINFNWNQPSTPHPLLGYQYWSARWSGKFFVPQDGSYTFMLENLDDAGRLYVDDKLIIDAWRIQPMTTHQSEPIRLSKGWHSIKVEYHQGPGPGASIRLSWRLPNGEKEVMTFPHGLIAEYFDDPDHETFQLWQPPPGPCFTKKVLTRSENKIDYNWGPTPHPDINDQYFSVRWEGQLLVPKDGWYVFYLDNLDDAARLWIDDQLVIDAWRIQPPTSHASPKITLKAGLHKIKLEYHAGAPPVNSITLAWESEHFPKEVIPPAGEQK